MQTIDAARTETQQNETPELLRSGPLKLLMQVGLYPKRLFIEQRRAAGLKVTDAVRALKDLRSRGMVNEVELVRSGRGGRPLMLHLDNAGIDHLEQRGVKPERHVDRGDPEHRSYEYIIERCVDQPGMHQSIDRQYGDKAFDLRTEVKTPEGTLTTGYEVVCSGSARHNAEAALRGATMDGVQRVVMACKDRKLIPAIQRQLHELDAIGLYRKKISVEFVGDYVTQLLEQIRA